MYSLFKAGAAVWTMRRSSPRNMSIAILLITMAAPSCLRDLEDPWLGDCAEYPDGQYEYGEIGIGTCIASPADILFLERDQDMYLAVSNSNSFRNFSSGSVLFMDWSSLDLGIPLNLSSQLAVHAVELPHFMGSLAEIPSRQLLAVPSRYSEDARTREYFDYLYFLDVQDPMGAYEAPVAEDSASSIELESDPFPVVYDDSSGYLFVGNRTSHSISVLDALSDPIALLDANGDVGIGYERWQDVDSSGSRADFATLELMEDQQDYVLTDRWVLTWVDGTYYIWLPDEDGLRRSSSGGDGQWVESGFGSELAGFSSDVSEVLDPDYSYTSSLGPRMLFVSDGDIWGASSVDYLADWELDDEPLLEREEGRWDHEMGGPCAVQYDGYTWLFFDGTSKDGTAIGLAVSESGTDSFEMYSDSPILEPGGDHDAVDQADPFLLWDETADLWRMYYSAYDGDYWSIGQAWSEDLETWTVDDEPVLAPAGDAAAPVVAYSNGRFHIWISRRDQGDDRWYVATASSVDGSRWGDPEPMLEYPQDSVAASREPPGLAFYVQPSQAFSIEGEEAGLLSYQAEPGSTVESETFGWQLSLVAGELLDLDELGDYSDGGLGISAAVEYGGSIFLDVTDSGGVSRIARATWDGQDVVVSEEPVLYEGDAGSFDADGVSSPAVLDTGDGLVMYYAGHGDGLVQVGMATSDDGFTWTRSGESPVLEVGEDWESIGVYPGSVELLDDGSIRLWYAGTDGERFNIGAATSIDGWNFTRLAGQSDDWVFGTGSTGEWDDTSVRNPWVISTGDTIHMWYGGFDGDTWAIGYAWADPADLSFQRTYTDEEEAIPVLQGEVGLFDFGGVDRPVVLEDDDGWTMFYHGWDNSSFRPGLALALEPDVFYKNASIPTSGDWLAFSTRAGSDEVDSIPLDGFVDDFEVSGIGLTALYLDQDRGFLYVASKRQPYIVVLDVRDDSRSGFDDRNYLAIEAVLPVDTGSGGVGFRSMTMVPGSDYLFALNDSPEGVYLLDVAQVLDDDEDDLLYDTVVGWLPASRGAERDLGEDTVVSAGPTGMDYLPGGDILLVTNFNDNSLAAYDLRMGPYGQLVGEIPFMCENPSTVRVTPDGKLAVVVCFEGDVEENLVNSQLAIVDVDPESDTWLEVLTWIANQ